MTKYTEHQTDTKSAVDSWNCSLVKRTLHIIGSNQTCRVCFKICFHFKSEDKSLRLYKYFFWYSGIQEYFTLVCAQDTILYCAKLHVFINLNLHLNAPRPEAYCSCSFFFFFFPFFLGGTHILGKYLAWIIAPKCWPEKQNSAGGGTFIQYPFIHRPFF